MIVEDIEKLINEITMHFNTNYKASTGVLVPKNVLGGWGDKDDTIHRFSDDFLNNLKDPLKFLIETKVYGDDEYDVIPDDIKELTTDFILDYDSNSGYNGTLIDLTTAQEMYKYNISFIIRDRDFEKKRQATLVPKKGEEEEWYKTVNSYTISRRPKFDHFSQLNDNEYKQHKDLQYKRETMGNDRAVHVDRMNSTVSEQMRQYFLADIYRQTTQNTMKNEDIF